MTMKSSLLYACRLLFPRKSSSQKSNGQKSLIGAMLCIGVSLIPLVAVLVISQGMIEGITGRMIGLSSQDISVVISSEGYVDTYEDALYLSRRLSNIDGVENVYPEIQATALAAGKSARSGAFIRAVQSDIFESNSSFSSLFSLVEGSFNLSEENNAVIGKKISELLGLHCGDSVKVICVNQSSAGRIVPKVLSFTVTGIVSCGYQELDALWLFIPLQTAFSSLSLSSSSIIFSLSTADSFSPQLQIIKDRVQDDLYGLSDNPEIPASYVYMWNELNASQYENFASTKILLLLIMLLIVLVASVNISSALIMIVMERRKEIAILKSVGASPLGITWAFLLAGSAAGLGGLIIGLPLGLLASVNINFLIHFMEKIVNIFLQCLLFIVRGNSHSINAIHLLDPAYYLQEIPVAIPFKELLIIALGTLLLSIAVSAFPAIKAGRGKPLDTLRKM